MVSTYHSHNNFLSADQKLNRVSTELHKYGLKSPYLFRVQQLLSFLDDMSVCLSMCVCVLVSDLLYNC